MQQGTVFIHGMRFRAYHGVGEQERVTGHDFTVSVAVDCDMTGAAERDDLAGTVSYADVYAVTKREMSRPSRLVEHVTRRIADAVLALSPLARSVTVTITKHNPPIGGECDGAGATLTVTRAGRT